MIEPIKEKLWDLLKEKEVSLAMIYNRKGHILWHKGREIDDKKIEKGDGFCKSVIQKSLNSGKDIFQDDVYLLYDNPLTDSAKRLLIKSIVIQPIDTNFFIYVDSGTQMAFTEIEYGMIKMLGAILKDSIQQIRKYEADIGGISGESAAMKRIKELVLKYSLEEDCVLLMGETGVGKSHIAELIHRYSGRMGKFIVAETTTINENLFESEIFGHKKGAFTGALENTSGLIDEADKGTLFFDEISEVPVSFQGKLLRFIDTKKYRVLGDPVERIADVRILAATNKDLYQMMEQKQFRQDLFYRLNILGIKIPPLRDRKEDIKTLVNDNKKYLKGKTIGNDFWKIVLDYFWQGNVRELFSVLKRAGILSNSPVTGKDIALIINENLCINDIIKEKCKKESLWEEIESGKSFWEVVGNPFFDRELNREDVKSVISKGLIIAGGKYIDTLRLFNLERSEYKRFMKFLRKHRLQ